MKQTRGPNLTPDFPRGPRPIPSHSAGRASTHLDLQPPPSRLPPSTDPVMAVQLNVKQFNSRLKLIIDSWTVSISLEVQMLSTLTTKPPYHLECWEKR